MEVLIITHSTFRGLNYKQAMECANLVEWTNDCRVLERPDQVSKDDIDKAKKIIMIVPEWNGSFPFSFKKLIDDCDYPSILKGKEVLLIGTSNSTFGNIMGITHLQYILEWVGAKVYQKIICVPQIQVKFANDNIIIDERLNEAVLAFCNC